MLDIICSLYHLSAVRLSGNILLPSDAPDPLPRASCVKVSVQELKLCGGGEEGGGIDCKIPILGTTIIREPQQQNKTIRYQLKLSKLQPARYDVTVVVNVGWCEADNGKSGIRPGDYHTDSVQDFVYTGEQSTPLERDVYVTVVKDEETGEFCFNGLQESMSNNLQLSYA